MINRCSNRRRLAAPLAMSAIALFAAGALSACGDDTNGAAANDDVASIEDPSETTGETGDDSGSDGSVPDEEDRQEAFLEYTECMRDHGIDMSDPVAVDGPVAASEDEREGGGPGMVIAGPGGQISADVDPMSEEFQEAEEDCSSILEDVMGEIEIDPEQEAEMREQMLAMSECMRDHDIDYPDPVFDEGGRVQIQIGGPDGEGGIDPTDPKFQEAQQACNEEIFGSEDGPFIAGGGPVRGADD